MRYFGKFGPMNGKVAIQVKVEELRDQVIRASLLLPNGLAFEERAFVLKVTKGMFINTTNDPKSLLDWAKACGREEHELAGRRNSRNSVFFDKEGDLFSLSFQELAHTPMGTSADCAESLMESESLTRRDGSAHRIRAVDCRPDSPSQPLDSSVAREFLYSQLYRLSLRGPSELRDEPGLYAVFEDGQHLGASIGGVPHTALRCVKFGMANGQSIRRRVKGQYFGRSHRAATTRKLVGDALIGRAIQEEVEFAGLGSNKLADLRLIWNTGTKDQKVIDRQPNLARTFGLHTPQDVREFESPVEQEVTAFMRRMRFIAIPASTVDIEKIENAANSLLSDVSHVDSATPDWLGVYSDRIPVRQRGLWASDGVEGGRYYKPYRTHPAQLGAVDDQGRPIADWLLRVWELIDAEVPMQ